MVCVSCVSCARKHIWASEWACRRTSLLQRKGIEPADQATTKLESVPGFIRKSRSRMKKNRTVGWRAGAKGWSRDGLSECRDLDNESKELGQDLVGVRR